MKNNLIHSDPNIMLGKPVVRGTRITVELILDKLGSGESIDSIIESYPQLSKEAIHAAVCYAADVLRTELVIPIDEAA